MDDESLLDQLPGAYAVAIRLIETGHSEDVVADALGVPTRSVPTLLALARAKLAHLQQAEDDA